MKHAILRLTAALAALSPALAAAEKPDIAAVIDHYAEIALAGYSDSVTTAEALKTKIDALLAAPSETTLQDARAAWIRAREPYQQTEAFRFGNPAVDEWEGKVNAWPLDEGLIDYIEPNHGDNDSNPYAMVNVIANPTLEASGRLIDASEITPELVESLHEFDGIEANVASGYHAIEFLLWGQDLNGTGPGAGERPATDYDLQNCTGGNCDRRAAYLRAATDLLIKDLKDAVAMWSEGGRARAEVSADPQQGLVMAFTGMGSLSYGEQAGERMKLGLMLHDPEEEHDCFSDNTHASHYFDGLGIQNVYLGQYTRIDGSTLSGPSLYDVVKSWNASLADNLKADIAASMVKLDAIRNAAANGMAYDQMLAPGNAEGEALIQAAIDALVAQTRNIDRAVTAIGLAKIEFEGSDSLDQPSAVFQ